jgi:hypothetical protein
MIDRVIDPTTGLLAGDYCPARQRQWFKPGTEPTEVCNGHYEQVEEYPFPDTLDPRIPEPVQRGVEGIGKVLRRIFRF